MVKRIAHFPAGERFLLAGGAGITREGKEPFPDAQAFAKEPCVLFLAEERDGDAFCPAEHDAKYVQLTTGKVGKAVKENVFTVYVMRGFQVFFQLLQPIPRIALRRVESGHIDAVNKGNIAQLVAAFATDPLHLFQKLFRRNCICLQLLDHLKKAFQKCRAL